MSKAIKKVFASVSAALMLSAVSIIGSSKVNAAGIPAYRVSMGTPYVVSVQRFPQPGLVYVAPPSVVPQPVYIPMPQPTLAPLPPGGTYEVHNGRLCYKVGNRYYPV